MPVCKTASERHIRNITFFHYKLTLYLIRWYCCFDTLLLLFPVRRFSNKAQPQPPEPNIKFSLKFVNKLPVLLPIQRTEIFSEMRNICIVHGFLKKSCNKRNSIDLINYLKEFVLLLFFTSIHISS